MTTQKIHIQTDQTINEVSNVVEHYQQWLSRQHWSFDVWCSDEYVWSHCQELHHNLCTNSNSLQIRVNEDNRKTDSILNQENQAVMSDQIDLISDKE